jgi:hypothetical protein
MLAVLLPILGPLLSKALDKFIPDPEARAKAIGEIFGMLQQSDISQMEVNKAEAQSGSLFVAGWRPFIGWGCGAAFWYTFLVVPITMYVGFIIGKPMPKPPVLDANLWELMFGMLGMGALRTYEKVSKLGK